MESLKQRIENALYQRNGFRYQHPSWSIKLWNKSHADIKTFLLSRFNITLDIEEYYGCMVLLYHTIPNKSLLVEFKDSVQYQRMHHKGDNLTIAGIELGVKELNIIEPSLKTVTVIGG